MYPTNKGYITVTVRFTRKTGSCYDNLVNSQSLISYFRSGFCYPPQHTKPSVHTRSKDYNRVSSPATSRTVTELAGFNQYTCKACRRTVPPPSTRLVFKMCRCHLMQISLQHKNGSLANGSRRVF